MSITFFPTGADVDSEADFYLELGGIGLGFAEHAHQGITHAEFHSAIGPYVVQPTDDLGVRFAEPGSPDWLTDLRIYVDDYLDPNFGRHGPYPRVSRLGSYLRIVPHLRTVVLPVSGRICAFSDDVEAVLRHLEATDFCGGRAGLTEALEGAPSDRTRPFRPRPRCSTVTPSSLERFFAICPEAAGALIRDLPWNKSRGAKWVEPSVANAAAERMLGFRVDVCTGCLVNHDQIWNAIWWSVGDDADEMWRVGEYVEHRVPTVGPSAAQAFPRLAGAAWSCRVDTVLSSDEVWRLDAHGNRVRFDVSAGAAGIA